MNRHEAEEMDQLDESLWKAQASLRRARKERDDLRRQLAAAQENEDNWHRVAIAAEAKLAQIAQATDGEECECHLHAPGDGPCDWCYKMQDRVQTILASEREVLAVVDVDIIHIDEEQGCIVEIMLPWTEDSEATVIVLRGGKEK